MSIEELNEKALAGRKLTWEELAQELEKSRQEVGAYKDQMELVVNGFAELWPNEGWTNEPHPELGDMTEEWASHILSRVGRLAAQDKMNSDQSTLWKTRLNEETAKLRALMSEDRGKLHKTLCELWPNEFNHLTLTESNETTIQRVVRKLSELQSFTTGGVPDTAAALEELGAVQIQRNTALLQLRIIEMAADGTFAAANTPEFVEGYPGWSPEAQKVINLRTAASTAIFLANQRNVRAIKFMAPSHFAEIHYAAYKATWEKGQERELPAWEQLDNEARQGLIDVAEVISRLHAEAMDDTVGQDDPVIVELLSDGDALTKSVEIIQQLRAGVPYQQLEQLDEWLREHFPRQAVLGDDAALDAVRRALEILQVFHTYAPTMIKHAWENVIRPAIHVLEGMGINILPPGTIVYGAQPSTKIHRPY